MIRVMRAAVALSLLLSIAAGLGPSGSRLTRAAEGPVFARLEPAPFTTVVPGTARVAAAASVGSQVVSMNLLVNDQAFDGAGGEIAADVWLPPGVVTITATATDAVGSAFTAQWDVVVAGDPTEGAWFTAGGQPKADQINATMRSLVEAFRWHLAGESWDGQPHPDLPNHSSKITQAEPVPDWVSGTTFDRTATESTLRSLVEAFRWHFWAISWDGGPHCEVPTHLRFGCLDDRPPQPISDWFTDAGQPIPSAISATLRSLVEAFRWHFWGYSWDGQRHPEIPTHAR